MANTTSLRRVQRRDRVIVSLNLCAVTILAWLYLVDMADMENLSGAMAAAMRVAPWDMTNFALMFVMWVVMMVGMMLPSAAPMILLFATINRNKRQRGGAYAATSAFVLGYVVVWMSFSLLATVAQGGLQSAALLSPMLESTSAQLGGLLCIAAGAYQWTPLKHTCLKHCRSPLQFVLLHWREGTRGALRMGLEHGAYCLGCCGFLMGLLFAGGVMNLLWVAAIALFVLVEKLAPGGEWLGRIGGGAMIAAGVYMLSGV